MSLIPRPLVRFGARVVHRIRRRRSTAGVHAVPITPQGRVVLVRLTYAEGWRLPGGGRERGESELDGTLRELREEIGLSTYVSAERLEDSLGSALFLLRGIEYTPRRTWEVEEVREFDASTLEGAAGWTVAVIERYRERIEAGG